MSRFIRRFTPRHAENSNFVQDLLLPSVFDDADRIMANSFLTVCSRCLKAELKPSGQISWASIRMSFFLVNKRTQVCTAEP